MGHNGCGCGCGSHFSHLRARIWQVDTCFFSRHQVSHHCRHRRHCHLYFSQPQVTFAKPVATSLSFLLVQSHPDSDSSIADPFQKPSSPQVASRHQYIWTMWLTLAQTLIASHGHTHSGHWHAAMLLNKECVTQNSLHSLFVFLNVRCSLLVLKQTRSMMVQNPRPLQQ